MQIYLCFHKVSYGNIGESLGECGKLWKMQVECECFHSCFKWSQNFWRFPITLLRLGKNVFYFSSIK